MVLLRSNVCESDAFSDRLGSPLSCNLPKVSFAQVRKAEEPENCLGYRLKDAKPGAERRWFNLKLLVSCIQETRAREALTLYN